MTTKYQALPAVGGKIPSELQPLLKAIRQNLNQITGQVGGNRLATLNDLRLRDSRIDSILDGLTPAEIAFLEDFHNKTLSEWYQYQGTATYSYPLNGEVGGNVLSASGYSWQIYRGLIPYNAAWIYHVSAKIRRTVAATDPATEKVYVGVTGVGADGKTLVNVSGADSYTSQHYAAGDGYDMNAHAIGEWVTFNGWFSGYGTFVNGSTAIAPTPLTAGIAYFRPTFILNYNGGDGEMEIDYIAVAAGIGGLNGIDGVDGADAVGTEYIFAKYSASILPAPKRPDNAWGFETPGTIDSLTWYDGAPDLDATDQYLFRVQRQIIGFPANGSAVTDTWSLPVVVGRFGSDGLPGGDGVDADGLEYIFAKYSSATLPVPSRPDNAWGYDNPSIINGLTWYDGAPDLDVTDQYLYMSQRPIQGSPAVNDPVAGTWTIPTVVGRFGNDGLPGGDGADGTDGIGTEYIFTKHDSDILPGASNPDNSWGYDNPGTVNGQIWYDGAPDLDVTDRYLFKSQRAVPGIPAFNDPVTDTWTPPVVVGYLGADGADGLGANPILNSASGTAPTTMSHTSIGNAINITWFYRLSSTWVGSAEGWDPPETMTVELRRNGTTIDSAPGVINLSDDTPGEWAWVAYTGGVNTLDTPGAGTHSYTLHLTVTSTWNTPDITIGSISSREEQ